MEKNLNDVIAFGKMFDVLAESIAEKIDCFLTDNEYSPFILTSYSSKQPTSIELYDVTGSKYTQEPIIITYTFNAETEVFELLISFTNIKIETVQFDDVSQFIEFINSSSICDSLLKAITCINKLFQFKRDF